MANLTLISSKSTDEETKEELEEIELPFFDIIVHEDETWFTDLIEEQNALIEKIKRDHNLN